VTADGYNNQCKVCKSDNPDIFLPKIICECGKAGHKFYIKKLETKLCIKLKI